MLVLILCWSFTNNSSKGRQAFAQFPPLKDVCYLKNLCMQIIQFTQCVDAVGEGK